MLENHRHASVARGHLVDPPAFEPHLPGVSGLQAGYDP